VLSTKQHLIRERVGGANASDVLSFYGPFR
jgi:hypothetical protein